MAFRSWSASLREVALKVSVSQPTFDNMRALKPAPTPMPDFPGRPEDWREQISADLGAQLEAGGTLYGFRPDGTCVARTRDGTRILKRPGPQPA